MTPSYAPAIEGFPDNLLRSDIIDLYSLVPYAEDYQSRAETRRCFSTSESLCQVTWTDVDSGDLGRHHLG